MKIVLYKPDENYLYIIDNETVAYDLNNFSIDELFDCLGEENVLYVTEYIETTASSILDLVQNADENQKETEEEDQERFLHLTNKNKFLVIYNKRSILFSGMYDIKSLNDLPSDITTNCPKVVTALKSGLLEIINKKQANRLMHEKNKEPVKTSKTNKKINQKNPYENGDVGSVDNPIEIDLSSNGNFKRN